MKKNNEFIKNYSEYLKDESRVVGSAEDISFPKTEKEVIEIVKDLYHRDIPMTIQGARTGLAASAVPFGGHIINLSRMNKILGAKYIEKQDTFYLTLQPGVLLIELRKALLNKTFLVNDWDEASIDAIAKLKAGEWFFLPDPTETSASIGGMLSCNASGARSFRYGSTREHISGITVVLPDGDLISIKRGQNYVKDGLFSIKTQSRRSISSVLPKLRDVKVKKNTAGYYIKQDMDMIDLFIGAEGTLGIITSVEVKLTRAYSYKWGITTFMPDEDKALDLVRMLRGEQVIDHVKRYSFKPSAIEFFNHNALKLLRAQQKQNPAFSQIQEIKSSYHTAVYTEMESNHEEEIWEAVKELGKIIEILGGNEEDTWVAKKSTDMAKLHFFRHATPECVNMQIDEIRKTDTRLTKLGTDMSVPDNCLKKVMKMYNEGLEENHLNAVIFGHIGNNHLHVNIIPRDIEDYERGKKLYKKWAKAIVEMGGTVSAEHAVGKLKIPFLKEMYSEKEFDQFREIKKLFDPKQLLNRGNIFEFIPLKEVE
ncbi:FAD-binding oxidoreductase [Clostridiaceae bacterium 35-E11]